MLVIYHKIVSHEYFMDEMQIPDLAIMTKYLDFAEAAAWAQTRQIMLCSLKPYLKKKDITASEFWPLPIDDIGNEHTTEAKPELIEWFKKYQDDYSNKKEGN